MFPIIDVKPDWALDDEPMGSKNKFWVERPDDSLPWLFKFSRINEGIETGEHWSEKLAAEFADLLGVPHARVELARVGEYWGSLSRMFQALEDDTVELVHGNELLAGALPDYDPHRRYGQNRHTLENILLAVQHGIGDDEQRTVEAYRTIGGYVVLDALVLNTDRHHENWALFRRTTTGGEVKHWLAPSFDHASSLGRELRQDRLTAWKRDSLDRVSWYAARGCGGVFRHAEDSRGANPLELALLAQRRWPQFVAPWLTRLGEVGFDRIAAPLDAVPSECMSEEHRWFVRELLRYSCSKLARL